ncbi:unnamed protein product [Rotaria sp. Silwood2]|nr:unnamed protein product [Rotaria sp. Silwood2]CAF4347574.1 unnamed protein product [Rotaria sp. Silwood2]
MKQSTNGNLDSSVSEVHSLANDIAIIGLAGRFPGADNIEEFWSNLINGEESLSQFSGQDLDYANFSSQSMSNSTYVKVNGWLGKNKSNEDHTRNIFGFDASFFGYSRREVELLDPQQRLFLEICYQGLEDAGIVADDFQDENKTIGVFGSVGWNAYLNEYVLSNQADDSTINTYGLIINNDSNFLCTRVSFKLNLCGPSVVVQTACSSSLVAIHMAKEAIRRGECHIAIAGGVSLDELNKKGYTYTADHILSPDGHCRALDASANGTVPAQGLGVVVLKPLAAAQRDYDQIYAVIIGSAINNDGSNKASYAAPNPLGQKKVIEKALIDCQQTEVKSYMYYIECHGTGTQLGDMIELTALSEVYFNEKIQRPIAIGSVKSNIGHVDAAAGVAGLIKTTLTLYRKQLPPSINCQNPNKVIKENNQLFHVNRQLTNISVANSPIYASISSFGIGGTNAHMIIQQYQVEPRLISISSTSNYHVLCWAAKTSEAANKMRIQLFDCMKSHSEVQNTYYRNAAYTSQVGRIHYRQARQIIVAKDTLHAMKKLLECTSPAISTLSILPVFIFIFPGQGVQYSGMGINLYQRLQSFRTFVDRVWFSFLKCVQSNASLYDQITNETIRALSIEELWNSSTNRDSKLLWLSQVGLFLLQYCLSMWLINMGLKMDACIGHSLGHYVTAVFAGILSVDCAMLMLLKRCELLYLHIRQNARGALLSIKISHDTALKMLPDDIEIAAINSPCHITVAGSDTTIVALHERLSSDKVASAPVKRSQYAFHSKFVDGILPEFENFIAHLNEKEINKPITSCVHCADTVTGTLLLKDHSPKLNIDASYWTTHCRQSVQFSSALENLICSQTKINPSFVFLDLGPGRSFFSFLQNQSYCHANPDKWSYYQLLSSYQNFEHLKDTELDENEDCTDDYFTMMVLGECWKMGVDIKWTELYTYSNELEHPKKISLPLYPFNHDNIYVLSKSQKLQNRLSMCPSVSRQSLSHSEVRNYSTEVKSLPKISSSVLDGVIECFASVLGGSVSSYSLTSDFFALGGDSLSAAQFTSILNNKCGLDTLPIGKQIQTRTLLTCKSVSALAALITTFLSRSPEVENPIMSTASVADISLSNASILPESGMPLFYESLYLLQEGSLKSSLLPLVLVHAANGDVSQYQALVVHLRSDQIVMAFRAPSLDGVTKTHSSLVDMGKDYLTTLMHEKSPFMHYYHYYCKNHPNATNVPFLLGGHSFGGLVAYEMACQLHNMTTNCVVSGLLLLDSPAPGKKINEKISDDADLLDYFIHYSTNSFIHRPIADELRERHKHEKIDMLELAKSYLPSAFYAELPHALPTLRSAMRIYSSQLSPDTLKAAYIGSIIFFRPGNVGTHPDSVHRSLHLDWLKVLNNSKSTFVLEHVPGDHVTMMQAGHVAQVGKAVQKWCEILSA